MKMADIPRKGKRKESITLTRGVTVPSQLHLRMHEFRDVNWSAVARRAWVETLELLEADAKDRERRGSKARAGGG